MTFRVERTEDTDRDLDVLFDFLFDAARGFGEPPQEAFQRAAARIEAIEDAMLALEKAPHQGSLRPDLLPGLRNVTKDRAIFYFTVDGERCWSALRSVPRLLTSPSTGTSRKSRLSRQQMSRPPSSRPPPARVAPRRWP